MRASVRYHRGDRHAVVRGVPGWWLRREKVPGMWSPLNRGFLIRHERIADLIARMEAVGAKVTYAESGSDAA